MVTTATAQEPPADAPDDPVVAGSPYQLRVMRRQIVYLPGDGIIIPAGRHGLVTRTRFHQPVIVCFNSERAPHSQVVHGMRFIHCSLPIIAKALFAPREEP